jgi:probable addiction module antidote protein
MPIPRKKPHVEGRTRRLQDPIHASAYLNAALEAAEQEHNDSLFLKALRNVADANQMRTIARKTGLNRESLYRMLSESGNPRFQSFRAVLKALGIGVSFVPADSKPQVIDADEGIAAGNRKRTPRAS